jgi:hypothetical protein
LQCNLKYTDNSNVKINLRAYVIQCASSILGETIFTL